MTDIAQRHPDEVFTHGEKVPLRPGRQFGKLTVYTVADAKAVPRRPYLIKGLMSPGELVVLYGEPGCGKSFLAQHFAWKIAHGHQSFGHRVNKGPTLYLALEGEGGFFDRVSAFAKELGEPQGFGFVAQPIDFFDDGAINDLIAVALDLGAQLIVVDTVARAMAGADENSPADMGRFIAALDKIRHETGALVLAVHHIGKNDRKGMRGHSSLNGAADVVLLVEKVDGVGDRVVTVEKNKNGPDGTCLAFNLRPVEVRTDEDGDAVTSCVVNELGERKQPIKGRAKLSDFQGMVLKVAVDLLSDPEHTVENVVPRPGMPSVTAVRRKTLVVALQAKGALVDTPDGPVSSKDRGKLRDALMALEKKLVLGATKDWVWQL